MPSLSAKLINHILLPLRGSKRRMSNINKFSKYYENEIKPCPPPQKMHNFFEVEKVTCNNNLIYYKILPRNISPKGTILYFHGGAYVNNIIKPHWYLINKLALTTKYEVIVPIYPLAPHYTCDDAFEQLTPLIERILSNKFEQNLVFMGDSAGAGLALALCQKLRDNKQKLPKKIVLLSPWLDVSMTDPNLKLLQKKDNMLAIEGLKWAGKKWAGSNLTTDSKVSPIYESLEKLPPISVFTGTADILNCDAKKLKKIAEKNNLSLDFHEYSDLYHVWMATPIPETKKAIDEILNFINK